MAWLEGSQESMRRVTRVMWYVAVAVLAGVAGAVVAMVTDSDDGPFGHRGRDTTGIP
jgi:hypothetical protein